MATCKLFPSASDEAKHTVDHLADHNKENNHTNAYITTPSTTVNLPKQPINDVLLKISIATEANAELPFLTDEDVTTLLSNCKHVTFLSHGNILAILQNKTPSDEPYDNVSDIFRSTNDILYSSPYNEIVVSNIIPKNCNGKINQTIYV